MWREVSNPYAAIGWIREELNTLLRQARIGLEAAAEREDNSLLTDADTAIEKIQLTLAMLRSQGASLLADEMHGLLRELSTGKIEHSDTALSALMQSLLTLDTYLDRLQAGGTDLPLLLLPILNDLRAARDMALLSEGVLFSPDLEAVAENKIPAAKKSIQQLAPAIEKWTSAFTQAFQKFLVKPEDKEPIAQMAAICSEIYPQLEPLKQRRLWWISSLAISGLESGVIENSISLRKLLSRIEQQLPTLQNKESSENNNTTDLLTTALLYYIAIARDGNQQLDKVRDLYNLDKLVMDPQDLERARAGISVQNRALFDSLSIAVSTELDNIKERLTKLEDGEDSGDDAPNIDDLLTKLADTLKVIGLQESSKALHHSSSLLAQARKDGATLDSEQLVLLAGEILSVETALDNHVNKLGEAPEQDHSDAATPQLPAHELWQMVSRLLSECLGVLEQIKEQLQDWMTGELSADNFASIGQNFEHLVGALQMANHAPATEATRRLQQIAAALLEQKDLPTENVQELFADAFTALEMFLAASRDQQPEASGLLELMIQRLDRLESGPSDATSEVSALPEQKVAVEKPATSTTVVDEEILDIFLEEFDSVFEVMEASLPLWLKDTNNIDARTEIRRGFHTLKGSGRMVGADEIAEFSWKVEMLLNQVVDDAREIDKPMLQAVAIAGAMLPAVRDRLKGNNKTIDPKLLDSFTSILNQLASSQAGTTEKLDSFIAELKEPFNRWLNDDLLTE